MYCVSMFTKAEKHAYQIDDCETGKDAFLITLLGCPWYLVNGLFHPYISRL